ncbi:DNA-binding MarR family transcriptional regulator [Kitasatospora sp. GAS204A]|uniref:MarR family winged helix-turn-helix transcriptional regulator n=1 Tax=unclassified Kitasatospora TaxID=2633591 RepID=UPI002475745E|nr:MarR family transcriptional regulator [Kitasatospora sp. GAS204B]MDH6120414.1 DNA-binding MarR family transcriptional regulator [Kitasatospora sp. GAS204B]
MPPADPDAAASPEDAVDPDDLSGLAGEIHAVLGQLFRRARAASAGSGLTASQRSAASRLRRDGAATTADLARAEFVRPQSMRMTVAALEEQGYVRRTPHPTDGRQVLIELTEEGRAAMDSILRAKRDWLTTALGTELDPAQRATLARALPLLRTLATGDES